MDCLQFGAKILDLLPFEPTHQQVELVAALSRYCLPGGVPDDTVFLLNGYAGTGKTSVTGALVKALPSIKMRAVLLAPTGRAAKVLASHARHPAWTIHRRIYRHASITSGMSGITGLAPNNSRNTVFIVDEASMISGSEEGGNLLEDLIHYVFSGENCRLILSGDTAQLPPVGCSESPAMTPEVLRGLGLRVIRAVMTRTVRQQRRSGILYNATRLRRDMLLEPRPEPVLTVTPFEDVSVALGEDLQDRLATSYSQHGVDQTLLVTRSNRRAVQFNLAIRSQILDYEAELVKGEQLMIARNNYYWARQVKGLDFIANGDIATIEHIYGTEERGGIRYADVTLRLPDLDITFDTKIMLSSLVSESPALDPELGQRHFDATFNDPEFVGPGTSPEARWMRLRQDPYYNALVVKYAYAVTCHKAQGGQWNSVFIDMGMIQKEALVTLDFYRWLYTATTRAVSHLTYIGDCLPVK